MHRPKGICHFNTEVTQKSSHKKRIPVATQIYKKPVLLSAATGNHILDAELRKGPRMSTEEMRGLECMTYEKRLKDIA